MVLHGASDSPRWGFSCPERVLFFGEVLMSDTYQMRLPRMPSSCSGALFTGATTPRSQRRVRPSKL